MELRNGVPTFYAESQEAWRQWLEQNHQSEQSVWLIMYKKHTDTPSIEWSEAVDEAICFGWIDSTRNKRDADSFYQYFAPRKAKSSWSKINKDKVARLGKDNKLTRAGLESIEIAKANGAWNALDEVEAGIVPDDLQKSFDQNKKAFENWEQFPRSSKRLILEWINSAKTEKTRDKRIKQTVSQAEENLRANHYRQ